MSTNQPNPGTSSSLARVIEQATARSGELAGGTASSVAHSESVFELDSGLTAYVVTVTVVNKAAPAGPRPAPVPRPTRPAAPRPSHSQPGTRVRLPSEQLFALAVSNRWGCKKDGSVNPQIIFAALKSQGFLDTVITAANLEAAKAALERHFGSLSS